MGNKCTSGGCASAGAAHNDASLFLMRQLRELRDALNQGGTGRTDDQRPSFANFSGNIDTNNIIGFPKTDDEIKKQIRQAKAAGTRIKIAGTGHSASPAVCSSEEDIIILSLAMYSAAKPSAEDAAVPDFAVDAAVPTVTVNAGWNLDHLMSELGMNWPDYILQAQTAGRLFSIGGLVSMCTHGGCMKAGLIADTVVALRVIDANGDVRTVHDEEELRYYRMSFGAFGVITHVTLKLRKVTELALLIREGDDLEMTEEFFEAYFNDKLSRDAPLFQQFFFDFYQMKIYFAGWSESGVKRSKKDYPRIRGAREGARGLGGASVAPLLDDILEAMDINYRSWDVVVQNMVQLCCRTCTLAADLNTRGENDAFWVNGLPVPMPHSHWVAYMIPIDLPSTTNIFKAVKIAYDLFVATQKKVKEEGGVYRTDCPLEARFIWSSDSFFAPAYTEKRYSRLYLSLEQPTLSSNLYLSCQEVRLKCGRHPHIIQINKEYTQYFAKLEQGWRSIDPRAKPHLAKMFGFTASQDDPDIFEPFDEEFCATVLDAGRKARIAAKLKEADPSGVFRNNFIAALVGLTETLGTTAPAAVAEGEDQPKRS